jgi:hypothetical protein
MKRDVNPGQILFGFFKKVSEQASGRPVIYVRIGGVEFNLCKLNMSILCQVLH